MSHSTKNNYKISANFKNIAILANREVLNPANGDKETIGEAAKCSSVFLASVVKFAVVSPKPAALIV